MRRDFGSLPNEETLEIGKHSGFRRRHLVSSVLPVDRSQFLHMNS